MAIDDQQKRFLSPSYRPDIDGLRAVAILPVLFFHAFPQFYLKWGGFTGVDIFFVISGFFISTIVLENLKNESFSFWGFYGRRIRRIFPALILIMASSLIAGYFVLTASEYKDLGRSVYAGAGFFANFILWKTEAPDIADPMLHLWSLSIEEQFYIIWPLLLCLIWKLRINILFFTIGAILLSFAVNILSLHDGAYVFSMPHTRVWELLLGGALAYLVHFQKLPLLDNCNTQNGLSWLGALLLVIGFVVITADSAFPGYRGLLPTLGTFLIILAGSKAWINRIILSHPLMVWVGLISYPLYLWHWQILYFQRVLTGSLNSLPLTLFSISISILLAWATYQFAEKPIRFGVHRKVKSFILVGCMVVCGICGILVASEYIVPPLLERHFHE